MSCGAWFRCFSEAFDTMCTENACPKMHLQNQFVAHKKQAHLISPFFSSQCFDLSSIPKHHIYLYSGVAFAWESLYSEQLSGLFFITNLIGEEKQFQIFLQGSLRACLPDFNGYVWSMVYGG